MSTVCVLCFLCGFCLCMASLLNKKITEMFDVVLFSLIVFLFLFYCMDLLRLGRIVSYLIMALVICVAVFSLIKQRAGLSEVLKAAVPPAACMAILLCVFCLWFTRGNAVALWDELRVWGAVPKAMFATERLQVGEGTYVFENMQSYPPGMHLFVYYLTALAPVFRENVIYAAYAIFAVILFGSALSNIPWRKALLVIPFGATILLLPCVFTMHGESRGYFYESLFIDPVLGMMAGYVLYLSATKPFSSGFAIYRFCVALAALTLLKDSGALFAAVAIVNAVVGDVNIHRKQWRRQGHLLLPILSVIVVYAIWNHVLRAANISNHLSLNIGLPAIQEVGLLMKAFLFDPMISVGGIRLSFATCSLLILVANVFVTVVAKDISARTAAWTLCFMMITMFLFSVGYIRIFSGTAEAGLPSYKRYFTTLLLCNSSYLLLRCFWIASNLLCDRRRFGKGRGRLVAVVFSFAMLALSWKVLFAWPSNTQRIMETRKTSLTQAQTIVTSANPAGRIEKVYLVVADSAPNILHHRLYFDLIGSGVMVNNFFNDANFVAGGYSPDSWSEEMVQSAATAWKKRMQAEGVTYLFVSTHNEWTTEVLQSIDASVTPKNGQLYLIVYDDSVSLLPANREENF